MALMADIWRSLRALPLWVQVWVFFILVPVNLSAVAFWGAPGGALVAVLAVGGILPNVAMMLAERGLSKAMALSHVAIWTPLVAIVGWWLMADGGAPEGAFGAYLRLLLAVDLISLAFDYPDAWKWWRGDRAVAGKESP